jgi:hypothetical protein
MPAVFQRPVNVGIATTVAFPASVHNNNNNCNNNNNNNNVFSIMDLIVMSTMSLTSKTPDCTGPATVTGSEIIPPQRSRAVTQQYETTIKQIHAMKYSPAINHQRYQTSNNKLSIWDLYGRGLSSVPMSPSATFFELSIVSTSPA